MLLVGDFNIHWDVDNSTEMIKLHDLLQRDHADLVIKKPRPSKKVVKYRKLKAIDHAQLSQDLERATIGLTRNTPLNDMVIKGVQ